MKKFGIIVGKWGKFGWGFYLEDSKYIYYMYFFIEELGLLIVYKYN